jgi:hypothetical protein
MSEFAPEIGTQPGYDNGQFSEAEVPTNGNSTKQAAPELDPGLDSPAKVADASC